MSNGKQYRWSGSAYASTGGGAVDSVAGKVGVVTLTTSDISGLDTALANKAASSHTHSIADVTGLQGAMVTGNRMEIIKSPSGISYLYVNKNSSTELLRVPIWF